MFKKYWVLGAVLFSMFSASPAHAWVWFFEFHVFSWEVNHLHDSGWARYSSGAAYGSGPCPVRGACSIESSPGISDDPRSWPAADQAAIEKKLGLPAGTLKAAKLADSKVISDMKSGKLIKVAPVVKYTAVGSVQ